MTQPAAQVINRGERLQLVVALSSVMVLAGCATSSIRRDEDTPVAVVQAADLMCGWLLAGTTAPSKATMENLGWRQWMTRADASRMPPRSMNSLLDPALAGYRLRFGEAGDIMASYWEDRCYGILISDHAPDGDEAQRVRARQSLSALESWIDRVAPDAAPTELDFRTGQERPHVARAGARHVFYAVLSASGDSVEWRVVPKAAPPTDNQNSSVQ